MSGIDLVFSNAQYKRNALSYGIPVPDGCEAWHFLGGSLGESARNLAEGGFDGTVVGSPTVNDHYLGLRGRANYLQLPPQPFENGTFCVVARTLDTCADAFTTPYFASNFSASPYVGANILPQTTTKIWTGLNGLVTSGATAFNSTGTNPAGPASSIWACVFFTFSAAEQTIDNATAGITGTETNASSTRPVSNNPLCIGSDPATGAPRGTSDGAFFASWSRMLSAGERQAVYQNIKPYYQKRGIPI